MKNCKFLIFIILILQSIFLCSKFNVGQMLDGMGKTFGAAPVGYDYNFEIWSDASVPIYVEQQGIASFMGAYFPSAKGYYGQHTLKSIFDADGAVSKLTRYDASYYFRMFIGDKSPAHENAIYDQYLTQLPLKKHDPNIFFFHVYTARDFSKGDSVHSSKVEMIGYQNPDAKDEKQKGNVKITSELSGLSFYNSSSTNVQVSLQYGSEKYTFTVEKYSYNSLAVPTPQEKKSEKDSINQELQKEVAIEEKNKEKDVVTQAQVVIQVNGAGKGQGINEKGKRLASEQLDERRSLNAVSHVAIDEKFFLRPNEITFAAYNAATQKYDAPFRMLKLPSQGFEAPYTIEIFQDTGKSLEVGIQGILPGNYDQAVSSRVRDVTPCPCAFWYQSMQQVGVSAADGYVDLPGQIWVVYAGKDSIVQSKVMPGQVVSWSLTRPLLSQGEQFVYFVYVVTKNDAIAENFVKKVAMRLLGKNVIGEYEKVIRMPLSKDDAITQQNLDIEGNDAPVQTASLTAEQQVATLLGSLQVAQGVIEDREQGVIGYLVGTDVFSPKGLGFGRFYYSLAPSIVSSRNLVSFIAGCLDTSKLGGSDVESVLTPKVDAWLAQYINNPKEIENQVRQYLERYGNSKIVSGGRLTMFGQSRLRAIMSGRMSFKYPSLKLSTVTNHYVYDFGRQAPENMPDAMLKLPKLPELKGAVALKQQSTESNVISSVVQRPVGQPLPKSASVKRLAKKAIKTV